MLINGKYLSEKIAEELQIKTEELRKKGITAKIAIVTVGPEGTWKAYVGQKIKMANRFRVDKTIIHLSDADEKTLLSVIHTLNTDPKIHGIIIQRPFNNNLNKQKVINSIHYQKDIDGFRVNSPFKPPLWLAVEHILGFVKEQAGVDGSLTSFLKSKNIVVLGKGEAGGHLIIKGLKKLGIKPAIIDSQTKNPQKLSQSADILICAVGKSGVVKSENLKKGVILIGIGMFRGADELLHGDYEEDDIKNVASFYTPVPGGVGPLNVVFLFKNLLESAI